MLVSSSRRSDCWAQAQLPPGAIGSPPSYNDCANNVTGLSNQASDLAAKRLELLRETGPSHVGDHGRALLARADEVIE